MEATSRGLLVGGDGMFKGGVRTGRVGVLRLQHGAVPGAGARHHDHHSDRGPRRREQRAVRRSPARRASRPGPSAGSRCRSRTATAVSTCRTTAPPSPPSATPPTPSTPRWARHRHHAHLVDPGHHHDQPQPAGLGPGVHRSHRWHGRLDQGHQEDRVVQHRRPDADDHRITGPSGTQTLDDVHDDRHGERRQGRQLADLLVP